jgi:hypothetical protein
VHVGHEELAGRILHQLPRLYKDSDSHEEGAPPSTVDSVNHVVSRTVKPRGNKKLMFSYGLQMVQVSPCLARAASTNKPSPPS